jgi:2-amino-4-hydroxy-6-hydroxymethyldihydropteridine diphosphokinase
MSNALLALGSNIGDRRTNIDHAIAFVSRLSDVRLLARSSDYRTPPWGLEDQPAFTNACIEVETTLTPQELFHQCQHIEQRLGRNRATEARWGPRIIDIDLLAYDDLLLDAPELTLPHPRLFERAFVLVPLAEIVPDRMIGGHRVRDAVLQVDARGIERLPLRHEASELALPRRHGILPR